MTLSYADASRFLWYNPETGELGSYCGTYRTRQSSDGYVRIAMLGTVNLAHRVIWLLTTGAFPTQGLEIDHINGNKADNRIINLRCVTRTVNQRNQSAASRSSKTGVRGVSWVDEIKKYRVRIFAVGAQHTIGYYVSLEEARKARAEAVLHYHA